MTARGPIITEDLRAESHFHLYHHMSTTRLRVAILPIHAHTSKTHTAHLAHTETIVATKTMEEVADNKWRLANLLRDSVQQLHADIAGDAR